jgi:hypothetical protein
LTFEILWQAMAKDPALAVMDEDSDKKCIMMVSQLIMTGQQVLSLSLSLSLSVT